jgi:tetratricopeptide (TPR) repeat protein
LRNTVRIKDIPRSLLSRYANLVKRMGGIKYALKILNPVIRNETSKPKVAEIIEYASCLTRLHLADESIELLSQIKNDPNPEIQFELAVAHVSKWEYQQAIPFFKKYMACSVSPYRKLVAELNLGAAYICTHELKRAQTILEKVTASDFTLLAGNAYELLGEIAVVERNFKKALEYLEKATNILSKTNDRYQIFVDKWIVIINLLKNGNTPAVLKQYNDLRPELTKHREWNALREIELFKAIALNDSKGIFDLYYGVPYPEFRKRILALWAKPLNVIDTYERKIGFGPIKDGNIFDVSQGKDLVTGHQLKPGQALHRLVQAFATDFYSPFTMTKLFSLVFKGMNFNPNTSPAQIYELIKRLNDWFAECKIPLEVLFGKAGYRLRAKEGYILRTQTNSSARSKLDVFLDSLVENGLTENFSLKMAQETLGLSRRTVARLLAEGIAQNKLTRQGQTRNATYSFLKAA